MDIVAILDDYHEKMKEGMSKKAFERYVRKGYRRPKFQVGVLRRRWLPKENDIRESAKSRDKDRSSHSVHRQRVGIYASMEYRLAARIRHLRQLGMPVETWMVKAEAMQLLHSWKPIIFPDPMATPPDEFPFKASKAWLLAFFARFDFSLRKIGKRMNKKGSTSDMIVDVRGYHLRLRVLQLSGTSDPDYGLTSPTRVFTHDQVPISLCSSYAKTVDDKGADEIYDATAKERDIKRFCTLNLIAPLMRLPDGSNVPLVHVVFHATGFKTSEEWDQSEVAEYHPGVVVSFQRKAWVDAQTHMHGLTKMMKPIDKTLGEQGLVGLTIEDNLSSHKTDKVMAFWGEELSNFVEPEFCPARMTENVQVIDRHIGIRYKQAVYLALRAELTKRLEAARAAAGGADGVTIPSLTPREKRILITHAIGEFHAKITKSDAYERGNAATGTWMKVSHCMGSEGPENLPGDAYVSIQHLKEYDYAEQCPRATILAAVKEHKQKEEDECAEKERLAKKETEAIAASHEELRPFQERANGMMSEIESGLASMLTDEVRLILSSTELSECVIGGSYVSRALASVVANLCRDDSAVDSTNLVANDVDVYHGKFADAGSDSQLVVKMNSIKYVDVKGIDVPVNTVECLNLSAESILANNDLNVTASCLHVKLLADGSLQMDLRVSAHLWKVLFSASNEKSIQVVNLYKVGNPATTCVRAVYKAMQMKLRVDLDGLDPSDGTLAKTQKAKFNELSNWCDNPLVEYQCKAVRSHFVIEKKHKAVPCISCGGRGNTKCSHGRCKKCCIAFVSESGAKSCTAPGHAPSTLKCKTAKKAKPDVATAIEDGVASDLMEPTSDSTQAYDVMNIEIPSVDTSATLLAHATTSNSDHSNKSTSSDALDLLAPSPLSGDSIERVRQLVHGTRPANECVLKIGSDDISQSDIKRLDGPFIPPTKLAVDLWLNDKILAYLRHFLVRTNVEVCEKQPGQKPTYFADSFCYKTMMQLKHDDLKLRGKYSYEAIARRCKNRVPGGNLLNVHAAYLPILVNENHWLAGAILNESKEIILYNPSGKCAENQPILDNLLQLMQDEFKRLGGNTEDGVGGDLIEWSLVDVSGDDSGGYPRQENGAFR